MHSVDKATKGIWRETAWNGIRFQAPAKWEIAVLENRYLLMENESGPVFEVRWEQIRGVFSLRRHVKKIEKAMKQTDKNILFSETTLPDGWKTALERFEAAGFSWESGNERGRGVILYCPICKTASLVQVRGREAQKTSAAVLAGFRDHADDGYRRCAIYDIRARIPESFDLAGFRFDPGLFKLVFARKNERISLYRWGPAEILLKDKTMAEFAEKHFGLSPDKADCMPDNTGTACEFRTDPSFARRFFFREQYGRWHFRRDTSKNRILCVAANSKKPMDEEILEDICKHYEAI